jgi:hypothetical protein
MVPKRAGVHKKPDQVTRGACACNDDKVIFENPARTRVRALQSLGLHALSSDNRIQAYSARNRPVFGPG